MLRNTEKYLGILLWIQQFQFQVSSSLCLLKVRSWTVLRFSLGASRFQEHILKRCSTWGPRHTMCHKANANTIKKNPISTTMENLLLQNSGG